MIDKTLFGLMSIELKREILYATLAVASTSMHHSQYHQWTSTTSVTTSSESRASINTSPE